MSVGVAFHELQLIRIEQHHQPTAIPTSSHTATGRARGNVTKTVAASQRRLLLGDVHTDPAQRTVYRPMGFQPSLVPQTVIYRFIYRPVESHSGARETCSRALLEMKFLNLFKWRILVYVIFLSNGGAPNVVWLELTHLPPSRRACGYIHLYSSRMIEQTKKSKKVFFTLCRTLHRPTSAGRIRGHCQRANKDKSNLVKCGIALYLHLPGDSTGLAIVCFWLAAGPLNLPFS